MFWENKHFSHEGDAVMIQIILDASVASKLIQVIHPVELCDPSGRVLGRFVPLIDPSEWEALSPAISEEELDRRAQSTEWYTTEEVLAHLKSLEEK
jgi:hypothetical protein